jgi:ABC-type sugar transport system ATPase subunit
MATLLEMQGVEKSFGGVHALAGVAFDLQAGEVHALVGQNGAGKSTLIKILAGAIQPDAGLIRIGSEQVSLSSPAAALRLGVGTVYQDPLVYAELTVTENIFTGRELRDRFGNVDTRAQVRRVMDLLHDLEVDSGLARRPMGSLSVALQQLAMIAKALSWDTRVMVFDEPTAILTAREAENLFSIIRKLRARGVGIIYISHRLEEIFSLADRVTVLKDGELKGTWPISEVTAPQLIELMAGRALLKSIAHAAPRQEQPVLSVRGLSRRGAFDAVDFDLHAGEILGFFGLVGAGRSEVAQAIFGVEPADTGEILLDGKPVRMRSPSQAMRMGIAYLPEDRKGQGLFGNLPLRYNVAIVVVRRLSFRGLVVRQSQEEALARRYLRDLAIKAPSTSTKVAHLSGGNQQKVVLAKWLAAKPRIFVLDEATRGIDVSSKQEIHNLIVNLAREGVAIIVISSELPEVLKLSDRLLVMREGRVTGKFGREAPAEAVLAAAMEGRASDAQYAAG